ncbi:MAG TPA: adenylosuccinate lyase, partial [Gemmatimonadota bacterium]|nr:adenylosuccinate lyase [Gemmatimonadota bacterium]
LDEGAEDNDFLDRVAADPDFGLDRESLEALARPGALVGRAPGQVERFLRERVDPIVEAAGASAGEDVTLRV